MGTCLNRGCIPSKLLIDSADVAETIKSAHVFGLKVEGFSVDNNSSKFHVIAKNASGEQIDLESDDLNIAAGRIPNSDRLDLEKTGIKINKKGYIITDRYLETKAKGIFALGDAIGRYLFKAANSVS